MLDHSFDIKISEMSEDEGSDWEDGEIRDEDRVTYCELLSFSRFNMAALTSTLCYLQYSFLEPILAERLDTGF